MKDTITWFAWLIIAAIYGGAWIAAIDHRFPISDKRQKWPATQLLDIEGNPLSGLPKPFMRHPVGRDTP